MKWQEFHSRILGILEFKHDLHKNLERFAKKLDESGTDKFSNEQLSYLHSFIETSYLDYYNKAVQTNLYSKE